MGVTLVHRIKKGFTLIEVVITLALITLILSICFIKFDIFVNLKEQKRLESKCNEILFSLQQARNNTIIDGCRRKIYFFNDKVYIQTIRYDNPPAKVIDLEGLVEKADSYEGSYLELKPLGTVSQAGHVTYEGGNSNHRTIIIQLGTGRIYLKEGNWDD